MRKSVAALVAALMFVFLLAGGAGPTRNHGPAGAQFQESRLTHLLGMKVEDPNAEVLGRVKDVVLDAAAARLEYVVVGSEGFLGLGRRVQAVPSGVLSAATILRGTLAASTLKAQWEQAGAFHSERAAVAHPFGKGPNQRESRPSIAGAPVSTGRLQFGRELLGQVVLDPRHRKLGQVTDVLVDLTGQKPPLALVCYHRLLHRDLSWAVPLPLLAVSGHRLVLDTTRQPLEQAPWFTERAWQDTASHPTPVIYRVAESTEG